MVNNELDTPNVILTPDETLKLSEAQRRLYVLENEISIANKNLQVTKKESEKAYKEKLYNEELLTEILPRIDAAKKELSNLFDQQNKVKETMDLCLQEIKYSTEKSKMKAEELTSRELEVIHSEEELQKKVETFTLESNQLLKDKLTVENAREAFLKASESLAWLK